MLYIIGEVDKTDCLAHTFWGTTCTPHTGRRERTALDFARLHAVDEIG